MYATAIDSSDLVADSGGRPWRPLVLPSIYRAGIYTNAQYLEARFGPAVRVICALIQVQYRTLVLAIIATTLYLTFSIVCGWGTGAWWAVAAIALVASIYTALGGLRSVAVTDVLQFGVMAIAGLVIWVVVWNQVGGWDGLTQRLDNHQPGLSDQLLHVGHESIQREKVEGLAQETIERKLLISLSAGHPALLVALAFVIVGVAYSVVNHTQTMRMLASKSEWDMKLAVFPAAAAMLVMTFFNLSTGVMGRALFPDRSVLPEGTTDAIYPYLVSQFAIVGVKGIVVAGVLAASLSTFDSIGSTLSALLTRDVYARLFVRNRDDRHYMRVGQWLTPLIIGGSFLYVPFMKGGMLLFYIELTSTFVTPLLTLFLMGSLTRVHRRAGLIGVLVGVGYGVLRLLAAPMAEAYGVAILPSVNDERLCSVRLQHSHHGWIDGAVLPVCGLGTTRRTAARRADGLAPLRRHETEFKAR